MIFRNPEQHEQAESIMHLAERKVLLRVPEREVLSSLSASFSWLVKVFICSYDVFKIKKIFEFQHSSLPYSLSILNTPSFYSAHKMVVQRQSQ